MWDSDQLKRHKPSPIDEAKSGFAVIENTVWLAVPRFLRKLDDILRREFKRPLPLDVSPVRIASWMGGDRDGNPNVTPEITREVIMGARWTAAYLIKQDIEKLRTELSFRTAAPELLAASGNAREPYRAILKDLSKRLDATLKYTGAYLKHGPPATDATPIQELRELLDPLMMMHRSLLVTGQDDAAEGQLTDTIRRLHAFGLNLMPLDLRQESFRHTEALNAVTEFLGIGSYASWDEPKRRDWLAAELTSKRPLLPRGRKLESYSFSPTVLDTLKTFELAAELSPASLGAYVISQCQQASDVMAVMLLQQDAGTH
jgi:phosphoenolpyruvate carboxylase